MADTDKKTTKKKSSEKVNPFKAVIELKKDLYLYKQSVLTGEEKDTSLIKKKKQEIARLLTDINGKN